MSARLVPLSGAAPVIQLRRPVQLVGRHPECDARIDNIKVSRRHCCLALVYDRVVLRDLGSRNRVRVNGAIVDEATLVPGDEIAIGPLLYRVESFDEPKPAPPAPAEKRTPAPPPPTPPQAATPLSLPEIDTGSSEHGGDLIPILDL